MVWAFLNERCARAGEPPDERRRKRLVVPTYFVLVCVSSVIYLSEIAGGTRDAVDAYMAGLLMLFVCSVPALAYALCTRTLPQRMMDVTLVGAASGILCIDWMFAGEPGTARVWIGNILIIDLFLMTDSPTAGQIIVFIMTLLWLVVSSSEDATRWGMYRLDGWSTPPDKQLNARTDCADLPCEQGLFDAFLQLIGQVAIFVVSYLVNRKFASDLFEQHRMVQLSIESTELVAQDLWAYDVASAQHRLDGMDSKLPPGLYAALNGLVHNLTTYRPFLPSSVLPGDSDSNSTASEREMEASQSKATSRSSSFCRADTISTERSCSPSRSFSGSRNLRFVSNHRAEVGVRVVQRVTVAAFKSEASDCTARCSAEELAKHHGLFVSAVSDTVRRNRGALFEVRSTSITALWGLARVATGAQAGAHRACSAALDALPTVRNSESAVEGQTQSGIGVSTGKCCVGNVGDDSYKATLLLGPPVRTATTLARLAPHLQCGVLCCGEVRQLCRFQIDLRPVDRICDGFNTDRITDVWVVLGPKDTEEGVEWGYSIEDDDDEVTVQCFKAIRRGEYRTAVMLLTARGSRLPVPTPELSPPAEPSDALVRGRLRSMLAAVQGRKKQSEAWSTVQYYRRAPISPFEVFTGDDSADDEDFSSLRNTEEGQARRGSQAQSLVSVQSIHSLVRRAEEPKTQSRTDNQRALLGALLPGAIIERLSDGCHRVGRALVDEYPGCSVMFADIVGFTARAATTPPVSLVVTLMELFGCFDALVGDSPGVTKIKTLGDCYMTAAGAPEPCNDHADRMLLFSLRLLKVLDHYNHDRATDLSLRVGINTGPLIGGVIGTRQICFDLWGDTVNVAARMEQTGVQGLVQVSEVTKRHLTPSMLGLDTSVAKIVESREVQVKGRGLMRAHTLTEQKETGDMRRYVSAKGVADDRFHALLVREYMGF
eukprot:TRINITY_DN9761_c0_g2_i10.p1 TRINITY_DN9761_c0_g2~~TRINITY_DN9761_c0_g2_i10.p1  ORF type:complete len:941 (+),score=201.00 TRINITY_DN9761_c0_g2_i10:82-2904(+)